MQKWSEHTSDQQRVLDNFEVFVYGMSFFALEKLIGIFLQIRVFPPAFKGIENREDFIGFGCRKPRRIANDPFRGFDIGFYRKKYSFQGLIRGIQNCRTSHNKQQGQ